MNSFWARWLVPALLALALCYGLPLTAGAPTEARTGGDQERFKVSLPASQLADRFKEEIFEAPFILEKPFPVTQRKLSSDLLPLLDDRFILQGQTREQMRAEMRELQQFAPAGRVVRGLEVSAQEDLVYVYIELNAGTATQVVDRYAWNVTDRDEGRSLVAAWVGAGRLEELAALEQVRSIRTVMPPVTRTGSVTSGGDVFHRADLARHLHDVDGSGIKVGVISDGVNNWTKARATGDLPLDLQILKDGLGDEGTAMLEIIHDLAPGARLFFHTCGDNLLAFNKAVTALAEAGCHVIVDDIGWIREPFFEDGIIAAHVAAVLATYDLVYVSAAGNAAQSHYQGWYYEQEGKAGWHDFSHASSDFQDLYLRLEPGGRSRVVLQWDDRFGASGNDYDLYAIDLKTGTIAGRSNRVQEGAGDPVEWVTVTNYSTLPRDYAVMVNKYQGDGRELELYIYGGSVDERNITPGDSIFGHPAVPGVVAVGALNAPAGTIAFYSSLGPVTIRHPSPELRAKPDLTALAGVRVTGAGGFPMWFYGTSAAAPHVAAATALAWNVVPYATGNQIRTAILDTAVELGEAGVDSIYGHGRLDVLDLCAALAVPGDLTRNGLVDMADLALLAGAYGLTDSNAAFSPRFDFNGDGLVDLYDLVIFTKNYFQPK
jgi:hypothetical protein